MKKIISLVLAISLLCTMLLTSSFTATAQDVVKTTVIDLTQDTANIFATTGNTTATTPTVVDGKLKVKVSAYERQLSSITAFNTQTWFPNYLLAVEGSTFKLTGGNKAIVEVKYTVTGTPNATHGTQIGIGNFNGGNGSNIYVRTSKKHTAEDQGKEFTLTSSFIVDNKYATKIAFSGGGEIEISSIVVHEIPAEYIDEYAVVKYVDDNGETTEFVKKNTAPKTPVDERKFEGWFTSSDLTGEPVTTITEDTTLYARLTYKTNLINLAQDTTNIFAVTGNTSATTATVVDGKLKVKVSAYERQLSSFTSYDTQTWFPNYLLAIDGNYLKLTNGNKAIVEVKYKVTGTPNADHGTQIGIGNFNGGNGSNIYVRTSKKHTAGDQGKEFTLTSSFTVDGKYSTKIAFSGGGEIVISSIVVYELPAEYIDEYAVVKYVDGNYETSEFVKKNTAPKVPLKNADNFIGWFASSDYSGDAVAAITEDTTLYSRYKVKTTVIDLTQDTVNKFATTGSTTATTATVVDDKLKVYISGYERQLSSITSYDTQTWFPTYLLTEGGAPLRLTNGNKAIVEVKYKITGTPNATHGGQIGIGNFNGGNGSNIYVRTSKKHTSDELGKSFTFTSSFTVDNKYATKIAFSGGGEFEISSIVVHEVDKDYVDDYAEVKYVDGIDETTEFVKKNTAPKASADDGFVGWFASSDFTGEAVTTVTENISLYAKRSMTKTVIDLTTPTSKIFATTSNTTGTTVTVEDGKLNVKVAAYERQLSNITSYDNVTWFPNYLLTLNGSLLKLTNGNKAIVEVTYRVVGTPNADHGVQIGIGNFNGGNGSNIHVRTSKKHVAGDQGKEFTLTSSFTVDNKYATKIAFSGGGKIEISSIVVYELGTQYADDYAQVKYVDGNVAVTEFAKKNSSSAAELPRTLGHNFGGWYNGEEKVTTISSDATLTAKWFDRFDVNMDDSTDVRDLVRIKKAFCAMNDDLIYDINRDNSVAATDLTVLIKDLIQVRYATINGSNISDFALETGTENSLFANMAIDSFVDSINEYFDVNLLDSAENKIVVGIKDIDESIYSDAALENLTGVRGDVYGLDDYKIFLYENNLYIEAGSDYATAFALNTFVDFVKKYNMFPEGYEISGKYYGENNLIDGYSYIWGDEFNGQTLDKNKWNVATNEQDGPYYDTGSEYFVSSVMSNTYGGPWVYPDENPCAQEGVITFLDEEGNNYYLENGLLVMNTQKTDTGYSATRINAKSSFTYGIMTARVKIATQNGACSTLWSRTVDDNGASVNEMDYIENFGADQIVPNLHTWVNYSDHTNHKGDIDLQQTITPADGESLSDSFHEITLYWTKDKIVFYFDGIAYLEQDISSDPEKWEAFHKSTYMIMGVSAPSGYYSTAANGQNPGEYMGELIDSFSENFAIDYIRVFQK